MKMAKSKGQNEMISMMIVALISLVIAIPVALTVIVGVVEDATDLNTVTDESINTTNGSTQTLANTGVRSGSDVITNTDGNVTYTRNGNYTIDYKDANTKATVKWININNSNASIGSNGKIDYQWAHSSYAENSTLRTLFDQFPILVGVAILLFIVGFLILRAL